MLDTLPSMLLPTIAILAGFVGLIWSADKFVACSAAMAISFGITPMIIGLTIVSLGTSAPEIMVSISASLKHAGDLAVGNALGSNIANVGLVLGATTLVAKLPVQKHLLRHEIPVLAIIMAVCGFILYDGTITMIEGAILLASIIPVMLYLIKVKKGELSPTEVASEEADIPEMSRKAASIGFIISLLFLMISSESLVWGAKTTAEFFDVSPLVIGLTVIAIGTSLPELAASMMSALKGHHDIAIGNIVGSNIFNLLAVMSLPGLISPPQMDSVVFSRDYMAMILITLALAALIAFALSRINTSAYLGKGTAGILLCSYFAYYVIMFGF